MGRLGAHLSIAGGLPRAIDRAQATGCEALQIFTKSANQWKARPLPAPEIHEFRAKHAESGIHPVFAHNSYLINVATTNVQLRAQSMLALGEEIDRAEALGLDGLIMHPGAYTTGTETEGLNLIGDAILELLAARPRGTTLVLLEHTAGQGTSLGHRFEHLAAIIDRVGRLNRRVGVCLDTCHLISAGYDIRTRAGYTRTFKSLDAIVGLERVKAFHLNDSKTPCGSRVDRHEHIGQGSLGLEPFGWLLNDRRFSTLPMLLETPKSEAPEHRKLEANPWDDMNLGVLRRLIKPRRPR